ncbi:MAG: antitoxin AF2212-like protein [Prosthecobacter sp.]|jgi:predicted DNA-binding antitoxin AbrB/MazE fold protein
MTSTLNAIYEAGHLRLLQTLALPERTLVQVSVDTVANDSERSEWLAQGERSLSKTWNNEADDVYNELLAQ